MVQLWTLDATNEEELCAALCQARSLTEWRQWEDIAKRTVIPPQNVRRFLKSKMNELPCSAAPPRPVAQLPGKSTEKEARKDLETWVKVGERKKEQELKEWTVYYEQYFSFRGWSPCDCEKVRLASPPDVAAITPSGEMESAEVKARKEARSLHKREMTECRTERDRVGPLLQKWKIDKNVENFFHN